MKYILLLTTLLTGCGSMYNGADRCQTWNKPAGYTQPSFCGSASARPTYVTRDNNGRVISTTRVQQ